MAKGTRYGGMSHTPEELADPDLPVRIKRAEIGFVDRQEVEPSVGMDSSQSSESEKSGNASESHNLLQPAHSTENPSAQPEREMDSDAHLMATGGQSRLAKPSARARSAKSRVTSVNTTEDDEFFE